MVMVLSLSVQRADNAIQQINCVKLNKKVLQNPPN